MDKIEWKRAKMQKRFEGKLFNYDQVRQITMRMVRDALDDYHTMYQITAANTLHAEPFRFGQQRISLFNKLMSEQIDGLHDGYIDADMMIDTAKKVGVVVSLEKFDKAKELKEWK